MRDADDGRGDWRRKAFICYYGISPGQDGPGRLTDSLIAQVMACKDDEARRLIGFGR